ncbi:hypothetical protein [Agromyces sp. NPDC049794]|uniref:hypothetical protein n=1 Tax=unclassified Agromyces TaxID=2639701 RepID=UPI0033C645FE
MSRVRRHPHVASAQAGHTGALPPLAGGLAGYRLLRRIASGERADVYLATADAAATADIESAGDGPTDVATALVAVRVYPAHVPDDTVATEIEAMSTDSSGSLPALYDVAGLEDGRCCLAVERIPGPSIARLLTERSLTVGEAVTILAPITVAAAELAARGLVHTRLSAADLLLDEAGRPRLIGLGALRRLPGPEQAAERTALLRAGHVALAELLEEVSLAVRPAGALDAAIELVRSRLEARPFLRCEAELERLLFQAAAPEPIAGAEVRVRQTRVPARITAPIWPADADDAAHGPLPDAPVQPMGGLRRLLGLAQLPDDLDARVAATVEGLSAARLREQLRTVLRARSGALTVGGLVGGGALVLLLTLVPPATADAGRPSPSADATPVTVDPDGSVPSQAAGPAPEASAQPTSPDHGTVSGPGEVSGDDPVAAARWLLGRRSECFATLDLACLDEVLQHGSAIETEDRAVLLAARDGNSSPLVAFDTSDAVVTVEMGDAVLIAIRRAGPEREPASLLVVRGEAGWRLREIFD